MSNIMGEFCRAAAALLARLTLLRRVTSVPPHGGAGWGEEWAGLESESRGGVPLPDHNRIMEASPPSQSSREAECTRWRDNSEL